MKRLELLDYGRFIAALSVVAFHYLFNGISNGKIGSIQHIPQAVDVAKYGFLGVEFFFIISGYVIFFSANNKSAGEFLTSRALRLFPAFWVAMLFTAGVAFFYGGESMGVTAPQVAANLTMFPTLLGYSFVDGVYWTLQLEWKFYFAVFALLTLGLQHRLSTCFILWPFAMLLAKLTGLTGLPYMGGYFVYFAAGSLFALRKQAQTIPSLAALLLCLYLCISFTWEKVGLLESTKGVYYNDLIIAAVICGFFVFFQWLNSIRGGSIRLPGSRLAGAMTYPLYLVHAHIGYMLLNRFATEQNKLLVYTLCVFLVLGLAYLIHILAEQKPAAFWHHFFARSLGAAGDKIQIRASALATPVYRQLHRFTFGRVR